MTATNMTSNKCCDNCDCYYWYFDWCSHWNCTVNARSICDDYKNLTDNKNYDIIDVDEKKER